MDAGGEFVCDLEDILYISVYTEQSKYRAHMFNLFNSSSLDSIHKYLKALGNYKRLIIYTRLLSVRRCNSTALYKSLYISQSTGSQHLKTLKQANLIYRER
jgi:DNA-binding MarR family transcriptional regulator